MAFLAIVQVKTKTDRMAGEYDAIAAALPSILAKLTADQLTTYGDGATIYSLGDPNAVNTLGPSDIAATTTAQGSGVFTLFLAQKVAALSSYLQRFGGMGAGLPASVVDAASYIRQANGCPDPSPQGSGTGSSYVHLLHPSYAALISSLTGGVSALPPDTVFAPTGVILGTYHFAGNVFTAGLPLMTAATAPYAPAKGFVARCGHASGTGSLSGDVPDGSLYVTLTGINQAGASVTWRGDIGTGMAALGNTLATLKGTDGGANGGTAAPTDRLVRVTGIAKDTTVSGGGTATKGDFDIITVQERPSL